VSLSVVSAGVAEAQNLVPNPGFEGLGGQVIPIGTGLVNAISGGAPDNWRAFAVNGSTEFEIVPVGEDEFEAGSPATNVIVFRVLAFGDDQAIDDDNGRCLLIPGGKYHAEFWVKSGNSDASEQRFNFGFPLFDAVQYLGVEPGGLVGEIAGADWRHVVGPSFTAPATVANGHVSFRCQSDGGEDAIIFGLPTVVLEEPIVYPTALACSRKGTDVSLSWSVNEVYDAIRILRDGTEIASLAPDATSYVDAAVPEGQHAYDVYAVVGIDEGGPRCEVAVYVVAAGTKVSVDLGEVDLEEGLQNSQRADGGDGEVEFLICGPEGELREVRSNYGSLDPTPDFPDGQVYFNVTDPAMKAQGTFRLLVTVYDDPTLAGAGLSLQYTNSKSTGPGDIANTFYPLANSPAAALSGSGEWVTLEYEIPDAGFRSYMQGSSDFRLSVFGADRLCIDKAELVYFPVPTGLVCRRTGAGVELTWTVNGEYTGLEILRNDETLASLATDASSYVDEAPIEGEATYRVVATAAGLEGGPACTITVHIVPNGETVSVDLGESDVEVGLRNLQRDEGTDGEGEFLLCGPEGDLREVRSNYGLEDPTPDAPDAQFYFEVTDPLVKSQAQFRIDLTVYDDPARAGVALYLQYTNQDSTGPGDIPNTFYPQDTADTRILGGTGEWIVLSWEVFDAGFRSFQQGTSDFRIGTADGSRICADRVDVVFTGGEVEPQKPVFHRGDANGDGQINITDGIFILNFLFLGGPSSTCLEASNPNDDATINITDGIYVLNFLFLGGPAPALPGPVDSPCGPDPDLSPTDLGCEVYSPCPS
jgi:hypothetical protein